MGRRNACFAFLIVLALCGCARAQCEAIWTDNIVPASLGFGIIRDVAFYDADGEGPQAPMLYKCGAVVSAGWTSGEFSRLEGDRWVDLRVRPNGTTIGGARRMLVYDSDGDGPARPLLVICGSMQINGQGSRVHSILTWNGDELGGLGPPTDGGVKAMTLHDFDGEGPGVPSLVVGTQWPDSILPDRVVKWTGSGWVPVGVNSGPFAEGLCSWDHDGIAATPPLLAAAGWQGLHILGEEGEWSTVPGNSTRMMGVEAFDEDGDGPAAPSLFVAGEFQAADSSRTSLLRWNASGWTDLQVHGTVNAVCAFDPDGPGPAPDVLVLGGMAINVEGVDLGIVASWDGIEWDGLAGPGASNNPVLGLRVLDDPSGVWGGSPRLVASGQITFVGDNVVSGCASWDGTQWSALTDHLEGRARRIEVIDPDSAGPRHADIVIAGQFRELAGHRVSGIARWDGSAWHPMGEGVLPEGAGTPEVSALESHDPDGAGPLDAAPVVAISSTRVVKRWSGTAWDTIGQIPDGSFIDLVSYRPFEGAPEILVACGTFTAIDGVAVNGVAGWANGSWSGLGSGVGPWVTALVNYDEDGSGPGEAVLVAAGSFTTLGDGTPAARFAAWDGDHWTAFGNSSNPTFQFNILAVLDDGIDPPVLLAARRLSTLISKWTNGEWTPLPSPFPTLGGVAVFDEDGSGPGRASFFASGFDATDQTPPFPSVKRLDGDQWTVVQGGNISPGVGELAVYDPDGPHGEPPLLVGVSDGYLYYPSSTSNYQVRTIGFLVEYGRPALDVVLESPPAIVIGQFGRPLSLAVGTTGGTAEFRWWHDGNEVKEGQGISGAFTSTLVFESLAGFDRGEYTLEATNRCGTSFAGPIDLRVRTCQGDANGDDQVNMADILSVLDSWLATYQPATGMGDGTADGIVNFEDVTAVLLAWGNPCR